MAFDCERWTPLYLCAVLNKDAAELKSMDAVCLVSPFQNLCVWNWMNAWTAASPAGATLHSVWNFLSLVLIDSPVVVLSWEAQEPSGRWTWTLDKITSRHRKVCLKWWRRCYLGEPSILMKLQFNQKSHNKTKKSLWPNWVTVTSSWWAQCDLLFCERLVTV